MRHVMAVVSVRHLPVGPGVENTDRISHNQAGKKQGENGKENAGFFSDWHVSLGRCCRIFDLVRGRILWQAY